MFRRSFCFLGGEMASKKKNVLSDVRVDAVGLVSYGANNEEFFLLKSQEEVVMPDPEDTQVNEVEGIEEAVAKAIEKLLPAALEKSKPPEEPQVEEVTDERLVALEKANQALVERLEASEAREKAANEAREKAEIVRKVADNYGAFPVKPETLGEHLYILFKSVPDEYKYFAELLTALAKQLKDGDLFAEIGGEVGEETTNVDEVFKTGSAEEIKKAMASMSRAQGERYLAAKREAIRKSGR